MTFISGPSSQDISEMQRLIDVMNGKGSATSNSASRVAQPSHAHQRAQAPAPVQLPPPGPTGADTEAMRKVLESFYGAAGDAVQSLTESTQDTYHNPHLREAMQTRIIDDGVAIGRWEVKVRLQESAKGVARKTYDVVNASTRDVVAQKLVVYEAAHAVVRFLNKGLPTNHPKVQEVLDLEETFHRTRSEAARFKQRFDRCVQLGEKEAADVFEARYQRARAEALVATDQIKSILESIR